MLGKFKLLIGVACLVFPAAHVVCADDASASSSTASRHSTTANSTSLAVTEKTTTISLSSAEITTLSETFGHLIGRNLANPIIDFEVEAVIRGIRDSATGKSSPMTPEEFEKTVTRLEREAISSLGSKNLKAAEEFLSSNASKDSVVELKRGKIQYIVIQEGTGETVTAHTAPKIHYKGSCLDGTIFGDSSTIGEAVVVPLDQTIPGFSKAVIGMKVGEKRQIFIHPDEAYGMTTTLSPNSLLVFDVEIVETSPPLAPSGVISSADLTPSSGDGPAITIR